MPSQGSHYQVSFKFTDFHWLFTDQNVFALIVDKKIEMLAKPTNHPNSLQNHLFI